MEDTTVKNQQKAKLDTQRGKFLTFLLGNEFYGMEIEFVKEIVSMQPITEVPELPEYIRGIINLRGRIIPVMDVRTRFKKPFREYDDRTCIIVIDVKNVSVGLIVDSVSEVLSIPDNEIVPPPEIGREGNRYIKAIGKVENEIKLLLDCDKLLNENEIESLGEVV